MGFCSTLRAHQPFIQESLEIPSRSPFLFLPRNWGVTEWYRVEPLPVRYGLGMNQVEAGEHVMTRVEVRSDANA